MAHARVPVTGKNLRSGSETRGFPTPHPPLPNSAVWVSLSPLICLPPKVRLTVHTAGLEKLCRRAPWWQRQTCSRDCVNNEPGHELVELHLGLDPRFCSDKSDVGRDRGVAGSTPILQSLFHERGFLTFLLSVVNCLKVLKYFTCLKLNPLWKCTPEENRPPR